MSEIRLQSFASSHDFMMVPRGWTLKKSLWQQALSLSAAIALVSPLTAMAASSLAAGGGCSKEVGGTLPFDASFNPSCNGNNQLVPAPSGATVSASNAWIDPRPGTAVSAGWADTAGFGILHSSSYATANTTPPAGSTGPLALGITASGYAVAGDSIVFSAPGMAGRSATVSGTFHVDGTLAANSNSDAGTASSSWSIEAGVLDAGNHWVGRGTAAGALYDTYGAITGQSTVDQGMGFSALVTFGQSYTLVLRLDTLAAASAQPAGSPGTPEFQLAVGSAASANFADTAAWDGFQSMTLADGAAVSGWSVASGSGIDYRESLLRPVPEPETSLLLLPGLGLIWAAARKRRQRMLVVACWP